jgi:hypothetical protein
MSLCRDERGHAALDDCHRTVDIPTTRTIWCPNTRPYIFDAGSSSAAEEHG